MCFTVALVVIAAFSQIFELNLMVAVFVIVVVVSTIVLPSVVKISFLLLSQFLCFLDLYLLSLYMALISTLSDSDSEFYAELSAEMFMISASCRFANFCSCSNFTAWFIVSLSVLIALGCCSSSSNFAMFSLSFFQHHLAMC